MRRWRVTVHPLAVDELRTMKAERPDEFEEVEEVMRYLALEPDPRRPRHCRLNVEPLKWDAPGWYRVRSFRLNLRVIYRVLEQRGGTIVEIHQFGKLASNGEGALQIMQASERASAYSSPLRERRKKAS